MLKIVCKRFGVQLFNAYQRNSKKEYAKYSAIKSHPKYDRVIPQAFSSGNKVDNTQQVWSGRSIATVCHWHPELIGVENKEIICSLVLCTVQVFYDSQDDIQVNCLPSDLLDVYVSQGLRFYMVRQQ